MPLKGVVGYSCDQLAPHIASAAKYNASGDEDDGAVSCETDDVPISTLLPRNIQRKTFQSVVPVLTEALQQEGYSVKVATGRAPQAIETWQTPYVAIDLDEGCVRLTTDDMGGLQSKWPAITEKARTIADGIDRAPQDKPHY